jgi:hypothetical protein
LRELVAGFGNPNYELLAGWDTTTADTAFTQEPGEVTDTSLVIDGPIPADMTLPAPLELSPPYNYRRVATSTPLGGTTVVFQLPKVEEEEEVDTTLL